MKERMTFEQPFGWHMTQGAVAVLEGQPSVAASGCNLTDLKRQIEQSLFTGRTMLPPGAGNIVGVGMGTGESVPVSGAETISAAVTPGEYALNIYVAEPMSVDRVKASIVNTAKIPALSDDNVPVNVIVTGIIYAQPHRSGQQPAPASAAVSHYRVTAGTIGCLAIGRSAPRSSRLLMLSNNHVLANCNRAAINDPICQSGSADSGCPADQVAVLDNFVPINFGGDANFVDCATGWCWPERVRKELVYLSDGTPQFLRIGSAPAAAPAGMLVGKCGRTTQLTAGRITDIAATIRVDYGVSGVALFADQLAIQSIDASPFSAGSDAGACVWTQDANRSPVGLLFASGGNISFANKIGRVLTALDIQLYT